MQNIFEQMDSWDKSTVCLYIVSILLSTLFAYIYNQQKTKRSGGHKIWIVLSYFSLWLVLAFSSCGADYITYKKVFEDSLSLQYWTNARIEKGYILLNALVRIFTDDFKVFHALWASAFLYIIYKVILYYKNEIDVALAIFSFSSLYFLQSMNLMRIYFAMALSMVGFKYYLENKYKKCLICITVNFFIHRSSVCLIIPVIMARLFRSRKSIWMKILVTIMIFVGIYMLRFYIFSGTWLSYEYTATTTTIVGAANIVYHIPIFILLVYARKEKKYNQEKVRLFIIYALMSFLFGNLAYIVTIAGRLFVYFAPVYILLPAYVLDNGKGTFRVHRNYYVTYKDFLKLIYVIYIVFRSFMMTEFFYLDKIMPYTSILG